MVERATGLILRTRLLTETSLIVNWLTADLGRISTVAKGARRPKSSFRGKLDLFYLADFSFRRSPRSDLHTLNEVSVHQFHSALREELTHLQQASYFVRLIEQTTETETPLPTFFQLVAGALDYLPRQIAQNSTVYAFEIKLLAELGLSPVLAESRLTAGSREILRKLLASDWEQLSRLKLSPAQSREIDLYLFHIMSGNWRKVLPSRSAALS
ncbi:MAG: DNA repair protein RecO [Verrucomicrobia bacterium]|nr:DNA repair protein RecO [Verrucomicrobiota bacterium]